MTKPVNTTVTTFNESYGQMPSEIWRKIRRFNITPAEYDMMLVMFGESVTDWNAMRSFITSNVNPNNGMFYMPMGVL